MKGTFLTSTVMLSLLGLSLAGCGSSGGSVTTSGDGLVRSEQHCKKGNFAPTNRQTFILIDAKVLKQATQATEFAESNAFIRDLVKSFADPKQALASGLSAPRERISVLLVPSDGSPAQPLFLGCVPGMSPDEEAAARQNSSSVAEFFTGDPLKQLDEDSKNFQLALIRALTNAAKHGAVGLTRLTPVPFVPIAIGALGTVVGGLIVSNTWTGAGMLTALGASTACLVLSVLPGAHQVCEQCVTAEHAAPPPAIARSGFSIIQSSRAKN